MRNILSLATALCAFCAPAAVFARSAPLEYYKDLARATGQMDGLSVACGKANQATVDAHKAKLRQDYASHGLPPASFNQIYDGAFKTLISKARANPAQTKQGCARLANMGTK